MGLMPRPSRRVKIQMVIAASSERPNESSNAESSVALMKRPPVLQRIAAPRTSSKGDLVFSSLRICYRATVFDAD